MVGLVTSCTNEAQLCVRPACLLLLLLQVRVELSDEQRQLYKAILGRNYESLVGECVAALYCFGGLRVPYCLGGSLCGVRCCLLACSCAANMCVFIVPCRPPAVVRAHDAYLGGNSAPSPRHSRFSCRNNKFIAPKTQAHVSHARFFVFFTQPLTSRAPPCACAT